MPNNNLPERPPGRDAPYGEILTYWMNMMGMKDGDLEHAVGITRTYPQKIKQGKRVPSPETATAIRNHLLETAQEPGWNGRPKLTADEQHLMDDLLRTSFARDHPVRVRAKAADGAAGHGGAEDEEDENDEKESATTTGHTTVVQAQAPRRTSISPLAAVGLIVLVLVLPFAGAVYYATHASSPPLQPTAARVLTLLQVYGTVTASPSVMTDLLTSPDANGWDEGPQPGGGCAYTNGAYHATVLHSAVIRCLAETAPRPSGPFAVQADVSFLRGDGGAGLVLCYAGESAPYYRFVVRPDGYFDLFDPLTATHISAPNVTPRAHYRLTAIVRASDISLYIDGTPVGRFPVEPGVVMDGKIGVFAVDGKHNPTDVVFHNFRTWELPLLT
jgi:hypothetical protein